jgi:hypothetical protein
MHSVEEILRQSGFTDQQITSMDQRAITAFSGVLSEADRQRQQAELERRSNIDFYDNQIAPSLVQWDEEKSRLENEKARIAAEAAFYRTQAEQARASGFIPADAPGYQQPRDTGGRYVAGTTGSPVFEPQEIVKRAGDGLATIADIDWRHRQLFDGKPLPIAPSELIKQADARRMDPMTYAAQTFGFQKREEELQQQKQEAHDSQIRKDATAERDKYWAERTGSNPDVRMAMRSPEMTTVARAVKTGQLPDPLSLNEGERRAATRQAIRADLSEQS